MKRDVQIHHLEVQYPSSSSSTIPKRKFGSAKDQIIISDRFDEPLPEFEMADD